MIYKKLIISIRKKCLMISLRINQIILMQMLVLLLRKISLNNHNYNSNMYLSMKVYPIIATQQPLKNLKMIINNNSKSKSSKTIASNSTIIVSNSTIIAQLKQSKKLQLIKIQIKVKLSRKNIQMKISNNNDYYHF